MVSGMCQRVSERCQEGIICFQKGARKVSYVFRHVLGICHMVSGRCQVVNVICHIVSGSYQITRRYNLLAGLLLANAGDFSLGKKKSIQCCKCLFKVIFGVQ